MAHLICAWAEGAKIRNDSVRSSVAELQDLLRSDGKLDRKAFDNLENLIFTLKMEPGKVPKMLVDLCTSMIEIKDLETSIHDREQAVMQELIIQLQQ